MDSDNSIVGDQSSVELPQAPVNEEALDELRKKARFSKKKEWKELVEHMDERIAYYQSFLPGNVPVTAISDEERGKYWAVADIVINELRMVQSGYEGAEELLKEAEAYEEK